MERQRLRDYCVINIYNPLGEDIIREVSVQAEDVNINNHAYFRLREGWEGLNYSHSELRNVWLKLLLSDDQKVDMYLLEKIDLKFFVPYQNAEKFIFIIEGCNLEKYY